MAEALLDLQNLDVHYGAIHALRASPSGWPGPRS